VEVTAVGVPPGLGSYAERHERLDARLAGALMGIQAVKGVEVGDGFALARLRGSAAHDEIEPGLRRSTNRAGGLEGGVTNGEPVVVRAAMKPLPTLMRPLGSVDLATGEPAAALVERSDVQAVEALAVVAECAVAWELARAAREKFGGDALEDLRRAHGAYLERIGWTGR
jgi:chorismate synthase